MSVLDSIITGIFVMVVVFSVLAALYILMKLFSYGIRKLEYTDKKSTE